MVVVLIIVVVGAGALAARYALKRAASERNSVERYHHAMEVLQNHPENSKTNQNNAGAHKRESASSPESPAVPPSTTPPTLQVPDTPPHTASRLSSAIPEPPSSIRILGRLPESSHTSREEDLEAQAEEARKRFISSLNREQTAEGYREQPTRQSNHEHQDEPNRDMLFIDDESLVDAPGSEPRINTSRNLAFSPGQKKIIAMLVSIVVILGLVLTLISFGGQTKGKPKSVSIARNQTPTSRQRVTVRNNPTTKSSSRPQAGKTTNTVPSKIASKLRSTKQTTKTSPTSNTNPYSQSNTSGNIQPTSYSTFTGAYPAPPGNYTVTLSPGEKCWVMAKSLDTGNVLWTGMTYPGQPQSIGASGPISIELGAAFQMVVTIAGKSLSFPANYSSPFTMTLNPV